MGRLICVVGNTGVGKTTLTRQLCSLAPFVTGLEQHADRPFQDQFKANLQRYGLANQIDYLLLRTEQELAIRNSYSDGVQDGGLEQDFFVFTRHFFHKGYLAESEYRLCERTYRLLRQFLPPPDLIIWLAAPLEVIAQRFAKRDRRLEIAALQDLQALDELLVEWLNQVSDIPVIRVDASADDPTFSYSIRPLLLQINKLLSSGNANLSPGNWNR